MSEQERRAEGVDAGSTVGRVVETAWDAIGAVAVARAGRGAQLKGVVHEVAFVVRESVKPLNLAQGRVTKLTALTNATTVDAVTMQGGRVVARWQLKDVVSSSGVREVQRRVGAGGYRSARLIGTSETAARYNATRAAGLRGMGSSGISSGATTRAADNAGAKVPNRGLIASNLKDIGTTAAIAGGVGAVCGAAQEAHRNWGALQAGELSAPVYAGKVAVEGVKGGAGGAALTGGALVVKEGVKRAAEHFGAETIKRIAGSNAGTAIAFGVVESAVDGVQYARGKIDGQELGERLGGNVGGAAGGLAGGMALGAAVGSVIPGVGTVIGAVVGGVIGGVGGRIGGRSLVRWLTRDKQG